MIRSIQIIDSLSIGGAERMAINIANGLANTNAESHLCATRKEGELKSSVHDNVSYIFLERKSTLDIKSIFKLKKYVKQNRINVIHAHSTSFFIAVIVKFFNSKIKLVWHDHHGNRANKTSTIKLVLLKFASLSFDLVYCVNNELKDWAIKKLYCKKVKFISNFPTINSKKETVLKGHTGKRILCLANLREPKNHKLLFESFSDLIKDYRDWTLHCVGTIYNDDYSKYLDTFIKENNLGNHIFLCGAKEDISNIISQVDIGVLTSTYEGLPMALLEYGLGNLPVISTNVGYCNLLISDKSYGVIVPSNDRNAIVDGLKLYLSDRDYRNSCAENFNKKVIEDFSESKVLGTIAKDYVV